MRARPVYGLEWILGALSALIGLVLPQTVWSSNQASRAQMIATARDNIRFAVRLENRPDFSLKPSGGNRVILTLHDTQKARQLKTPRKKTGGMPGWSVDEQQGSLLFPLRLKGAPRSISCAWRENEKLFLLETTGGGKAENTNSTGKKPNVLKSLLFGLQDTATRMVLAVDHRPQWEMGYKDDEGLALTLEAVSKVPYNRKYGPLKRIKQAVLLKRENNTRVSITPEAPFSHVSITWHGELRRLLMDLYDGAGVLKDSDLLAMAPAAAKKQPRKTSRPRPDAAQHASPNQETKDKAALRKPLPMTHREKNENTPPKPGHEKNADTPPIRDQKEAENVPPVDEVQINEPSGATTTPSRPEKMYFVRKKIPQRPGIQTASAKRAPAVTPPQMNIQPAVELTLDRSLPGQSEIEAWSHQLTTEEAFLFGRIQEAWASKDYEKGASLIDQFVMQYPDSPLAENVTFLRGDFRLHLLQSGRHDILPVLMENYQSAIAR
ncbi:MAG: hypothetical protein JRJ85_15995, partial [Deltaproteobacteria bacterium]|nr:hypothetical protein [Deltaproteobacteria bacterium]